MSSGNHPIATTARFLYLNFYAFLLLLLGGGAIVILLLWPTWYLVVAGVVVAFVCIRGGMRILLGWPDKKRKYDILVARNSAGIRPDTFSEFMQAPCGRLLVRLVLADLGTPGGYSTLKALRPPLRQRLRNECSRNSRRTVVHIINDDRQTEQ